MSVSPFTALSRLAACAAVLGLAATAAAEELRITYASPNAVYWDIDVAIEKGYFRAEGFAPRKIALQSSVGSTQMLISGSTHMAATSPEPIIVANERGARDAAIFLAPVRRVAWSFVARPGIKSFADLKGRKIGVSSTKGGESALIRILLAKHGIARSDFRYLRVGITPLKYAALRKGSIAAAVLFQPTGLLAISKGMTNLANFSEIETYPYPIYAVSRKWALADGRGARLARAIIRAQAFIHDPANRKEASAILAKYTKRSPEVIAATYELFLEKARVYNKGGRPDLKGIERLIGIMLDQKILKKRPSGTAAKYVLPFAAVGLK